jgi:hypothetical protein
MGRLYILTEERVQENGRKQVSKVSSRVEELFQFNRGAVPKR